MVRYFCHERVVCFDGWFGDEFFPYVVLDRLSVSDAAAGTPTMAVVLIGVGITMPLSIAYSIFAYWVIGYLRARRRIWFMAKWTKNRLQVACFLLMAMVFVMGMMGLWGMAGEKPCCVGVMAGFLLYYGCAV